MKTLKRSLAVAVALAAFGAAAPAMAYHPWKKGVWVEPGYGYSGGKVKHLGGYVGLGGLANAPVATSGLDRFLGPGGGFSLFVGGRLAPFFSIEGNWRASFHNERYDVFGDPISYITLQSVGIDGKFHFPLPGVFEPYVQCGAGAYFLGDQWDFFSQGFGFDIGGGFDVWLSPFVTFGGRLLYTGARLGSLEFARGQDATFISGVNGELNVSFRF